MNDKISLELAKELKDNGLMWSPKVGDWFTHEFSDTLFLLAYESSIKGGSYIKYTNTKNEHYPNSHLLTMEEFLQMKFIWHPSFIDMLNILRLKGFIFTYEAKPIPKGYDKIKEIEYIGMIHYNTYDNDGVIIQNPMLKFKTPEYTKSLTEAIGICLSYLLKNPD